MNLLEVGKAFNVRPEPGKEGVAPDRVLIITRRTLAEGVYLFGGFLDVGNAYPQFAEWHINGKPYFHTKYLEAPKTIELGSPEEIAQSKAEFTVNGGEDFV